MVTSFYLFPVKHLREVTPFIRKASLLNDIGWDVQRPFLGVGVGREPSATTPPPPPLRADQRAVPLLLCHLKRRPTPTPTSPAAAESDAERVVEIHSPDGLHVCLLRAADALQAAQWSVPLSSIV